VFDFRTAMVEERAAVPEPDCECDAESALLEGGEGPPLVRGPWLSCRPRRVAAVAVATGLLSCAAVARTHPSAWEAVSHTLKGKQDWVEQMFKQTQTAAASESALAKSEEAGSSSSLEIVQLDVLRQPGVSCFMGGIKWVPDMAGHERQEARTVESCQIRCRRVVDCTHVTFWEDGGCHLANDDALRHIAPATTVAGPPMCEEKLCFMNGMVYEPVGNRSEQNSAASCHMHCMDNEACNSFNFWPDGGCHVQGPEAKLVPGDAYVVSGHANCPIITTTTTTTMHCYDRHTKYHPPDMPGRHRSTHGTVEDCMNRCQHVEGCAHITYWQDHGCHISDKNATLVQSDHLSMTGNPECLWKCYKSGTQYKPLNMRGEIRTKWPTIGACQKHCRSVFGCAFFTYFPDGGCHVAPAHATVVEAGPEDFSGPVDCDLEDDR